METKDKTSIPVPKAVAELLVDDPEREALDIVLLHLINPSG